MNKPEITYRAYKASDKKELTRCMDELEAYFVAHDKFGWLWHPSTFAKRYTDYILSEYQSCQGRFFLAVDGKTIVGFVSGRIEKPDAIQRTYVRPGEKLCWLDFVYVDPRYRGKKIGSSLLVMFEKHFAKKGCTVIRLEAQGDLGKLTELYAKHGYQPWFFNMAKRLRQPKAKKRK